jgi:hypothetical protein
MKSLLAVLLFFSTTTAYVLACEPQYPDKVLRTFTLGDRTWLAAGG